MQHQYKISLFLALTRTVSYNLRMLPQKTNTVHLNVMVLLYDADLHELHATDVNFVHLLSKLLELCAILTELDRKQHLK